MARKLLLESRMTMCHVDGEGTSERGLLSMGPFAKQALSLWLLQFPSPRQGPSPPCLSPCLQSEVFPTHTRGSTGSEANQKDAHTQQSDRVKGLQTQWPTILSARHHMKSTCHDIHSSSQHCSGWNKDYHVQLHSYTDVPFCQGL